MINIVTTISSEIDNLKKRIVKVLRLGKSDIRTAHEIGPFGIDSSPVKDLRAVYLETGERGKEVLIGYINKNQQSLSGEIRIYSTNADGQQQTYLWLKNDGTMEVGGNSDNLVRFKKLEEGFNKLVQDHNSLVTLVNTHVHPGVTSGPSSTATILPITQASQSTASIAQAKINDIYTD